MTTEFLGLEENERNRRLRVLDSKTIIDLGLEMLHQRCHSSVVDVIKARSKLKGYSVIGMATANDDVLAREVYWNLEGESLVLKELNMALMALSEPSE